MLVTLYLARVCAWQIAWQDANQLDYLANAEFYSLVICASETSCLSW